MSRRDEELFDAYLDACLTAEVEDPASFCARHEGVGGTLRSRIEALYSVYASGNGSSAAPLPVPPAADLPFERLGEFRLLRRLKKGGMGQVFLAEQESLRRTVALKVVRPELRASPTAQERFRREGLAIARLRHPGIVQVYAVGEDQDVRYIAMELVRGRGLDEILEEQGALAPFAAAGWAREIADALAHAHDQGIIHRDVKPANIVITPEGRSMLLDFGVARDIEMTASLTQSFTGSPQYSAPELIAGRTTDGRTDVYGLGMTLYECVAGRLPFEAESLEQLFHRALTEPPPPLRDVPRDFDVIVRTALAKDPAKRYPSARALAADLDAFVERRPIAARPPRLRERVRHWVRSRPGTAAALATVFASLVVGLVVLQVQRRTARIERERDARALVARAQARVGEFARNRRRFRDLESELQRLREGFTTRYMTDEEDETLHRKEQEIESFRRDRTAIYHEVLDLLRAAERLDPDVGGARDVRLTLFAEKWREAKQWYDDSAADYYLARVREFDREGRFVELEGARRALSIASDPPGADVYVFRYVDARDERRRVPEPWRGGAPVPPGAWALRVLADAGPARRDDHIVALAGHPVGEALLTPDGDRLVRVGDCTRPTAWHLEHGTPPFVFARGGPRPDLDGLEVLTAAELAARGGVRARLVRAGETFEVELPAGIAVRLTTAPAFATPACRAGQTPLTLEVDAGEYLFLVRSAAHVDARLPLLVEERGPAEFRLPLLPRGVAPAGFVHVACGDTPFCIMEREVTCAEYLQFLNDPATRRAIDASKEPALFPRDIPTRLKGGEWERLPDGRYVLPPAWRPDWPIIGISWNDAKAYAAWRDARAAREGDPWTYAIPTMREFHAASVGLVSWYYPFGNRWQPKWVSSCFARPRANPEPVRRFPRDESPLGVFDLCGSAAEWIDDWYDESRGHRRVGGGSWGHADPERFKPWGFGYPPWFANGTTGMRLVARRRR